MSDTYSSTLLEILNEQRKQGEFCDVHIIAEDGISYDAHGCVLAGSSQFLKTEFSLEANKCSSKQRELILTGVPSNVLENLLNILYTGNMTSCSRLDHIEILKKHAIEIGFHGVEEMCTKYMEKPEPKAPFGKKRGRKRKEDKLANLASNPNTSRAEALKETPVDIGLGLTQRGVPRRKSSLGVYRAVRKQRPHFDESSRVDSSSDDEDSPHSSSQHQHFTATDSNDEKFTDDIIVDDSGAPDELAVKADFQEIQEKLGATQEDVSMQSSEQKNDAKQYKDMLHARRYHLLDVNKKPETEEERADWKTCKYCSRFKGRRKGRFDYHVTYCLYSTSRCDICSKPFLNAADKKKHDCSARPLASMVCDTCGKVLASKYSLALHMKVHAGVKELHCDQCGKDFRRRIHLNAHKAHVHSTARPFQCTKCKQRFALKYELNRHAQRHSEEPQYVCDVCGVKFFERAKMTSHKKESHLQTPGTDSPKEIISVPKEVTLEVTIPSGNPPSGTHAGYNPQAISDALEIVSAMDVLRDSGQGDGNHVTSSQPVNLPQPVVIQTSEGTITGQGQVVFDSVNNEYYYAVYESTTTK